MERGDRVTAGPLYDACEARRAALTLAARRAGSKVSPIGVTLRNAAGGPVADFVRLDGPPPCYELVKIYASKTLAALALEQKRAA